MKKTVNMIMLLSLIVVLISGLLLNKANAYYFNSNPACSIRLCFCDQRHCSHATKPYV